MPIVKVFTWVAVVCLTACTVNIHDQQGDAGLGGTDNASTGATSSIGGSAGHVGTVGGQTASGGSTGSSQSPSGGAAAGGSAISTTTHAGSTSIAAGGSAGSSQTPVGGSTTASIGGSTGGNTVTGGTGNSVGGGTFAGTGGGLWDLIPATDLLTVSPVADTARTVSVALPVEGGTLSATAADGTVFDLTVPAKALFEPVTVSMTPVQFPLQPFGSGAVFGVQLEPAGLTFFNPITLVITPPTGSTPPLAQQIPFGWSGSNGELELAMPDPTDSRLVVHILHFSGYAYATALMGASATLAPLRHRIGGSAEARLQSAIAELLGADRLAKVTGSGDDKLETAAELQTLMDQYDKEVIQPRVAAAGQSCAAGRLAENTLKTVIRQNELLTMPTRNPAYTDQYLALIEGTNGICLDEEYALCRDHHIIQRLLPVYISMVTETQFAGENNLGKAWDAKAWKYMEQCWRFDLDFKSSAGNSTPGVAGWTFSESMEGIISLRLAALDLSGTLQGSGELVSTAYSMQYNKSCWAVDSIVQAGTTLAVTDLSWDRFTDPTKVGYGQVSDFKLKYIPAMNDSSHVEVDTCVTPADRTSEQFSWSSPYLITIGNFTQYLDAKDLWHFSNWVVRNDGGAVLATKSVHETDAHDGIIEDAAVDLTLTHTPAP